MIDLVCPGRYPALEILDPFESSLLEHPVGLSAAATHLAVHDDVVLAVQLIHPRRELTEWDELRAVRFEITDLPFVQVAHVDDGERLAAIQFCLQIGDGDFPVSRFGRLLLGWSDATELIVIDLWPIAVWVVPHPSSRE